MVKAQRFVYANKYVGEAKETDFALVTEELGDLKDGEVLVKAEFLSVDPYQRRHMAFHPVGTTIIGGQVAKVLDSKHPKFPVGSTIYGHFGWRSHTIFNPDDDTPRLFPTYVLPSFGDLSASLALGVLGMPGNTALYGLRTICKPKPGETIVVTGAAGAIGNIVGQLAKADGCTVVGLTGDDAKCEWLRSIGFDHAINYKTANVADALRQAAPDGYDCYFDNVGGALSAIILSQMRYLGRICVCGAVSSYNDADVLVPAQQSLFVFKQLKMEGFLVPRLLDGWLEGIETLHGLVASGKVRIQEAITEGFEQLPKALISLMRGGNAGKAVVKVIE